MKRFLPETRRYEVVLDSFILFPITDQKRDLKSRAQTRNLAIKPEFIKSGECLWKQVVTTQSELLA